MRRVQIESPCAPQTPLPDVSCSCPHEPWPGGHWPPDCDNCQARDRRKAETERNRRYLAACLRDCIRRGETPYASHGLLTLPGVLNDADPVQREQGIAAGFAMREAMNLSAFYIDCGWSTGMRSGEAHATALIAKQIGYAERYDDPCQISHAIEIRELGPDWDKEVA